MDLVIIWFRIYAVQSKHVHLDVLDLLNVLLVFDLATPRVSFLVGVLLRTIDVHCRPLSVPCPPATTALQNLNSFETAAIE